MTTNYEDFRVLPLKFNAESTAPHYLFFKPHKVRAEEPTKPRDRTLFCANIPPWATPDALQRVFQKNGAIEAVYFQEQPSVGPPPLPPGDPATFPPTTNPYKLGSGFRFGYLVFERPQGVKNAMTKMSVELAEVLSTSENPVKMGLCRWAEDYNQTMCVEQNVVKENIEQFMLSYDQQVAMDKKANEELEEPDEDGWVTVTRNVKKTPAKPEQEISEKEKAKGKKNRKKKKKLVLQNFYSHQIKEDKLSRIQDLRNKFEEDKQKIAKMKSERKFRPF